MNYANIKTHDVADGLGVRVALYVSGCRNYCKGCHNKDAWDFGYGKEYTQETEEMIIELLRDENIQGLSILGGEPLDICNSFEVLRLILNVRKDWKERGLQKDIWLYTGYRVTDFNEFTDRGNDTFDNIVSMEVCNSVDVIVEGPFIEEKKNALLNFRGSSNQNIIVQKFNDDGKLLSQFCVNEKTLNEMGKSEKDVPNIIEDYLNM